MQAGLPTFRRNQGQCVAPAVARRLWRSCWNGIEAALSDTRSGLKLHMSQLFLAHLLVEGADLRSASGVLLPSDV